jgi:hypothetical protein
MKSGRTNSVGSFELDANQQAQVSHVGWAAFLLSAAIFLGASWWIALIVFVSLEGFKEAVIDPRWETVEMAGSGWQDFFWWCVGDCFGLFAAKVLPWILRLL